MESRHRRACAGFKQVVAAVGPDQWGGATPCAEWDARALVEHVIGFHEYLLLRPAGVRAHRPRHDPARRWQATEQAIRLALDDPAALHRDADYFDGATRRPGDVLAALTSDVLVHTWDLGRAVGVPAALELDLCELAYRDAVAGRDRRRTSGLFGPEVPVSPDADLVSRLVGLLGRDPAWVPPAGAGP